MTPQGQMLITALEILKIGPQGAEIWGMGFSLTHLPSRSLFVAGESSFHGLKFAQNKWNSAQMSMETPQ